MDPNLAVDQLRMRLLVRGKSEERVDEICLMAISEINESITSILADGIDEIMQLGLDNGIDELVEQIAVKRVGNSFSIGSKTGKTDFSTPPFPMLPRLISGGKVAEDGHRYKVIPIPDEKPIVNRSLSLNDAVHERSNTMERARTALRDKKKPSAYAMAEDYIASMTGVKVNKSVENAGGSVHFRTASEHQDARTQWVRPAQDIDLTQQIADINRNVDLRIQQDVSMIINKYEGY